MLKYIISCTKTLQLLVVNLTYCISDTHFGGWTEHYKELAHFRWKFKEVFRKINKQDAQEERDWWHDQFGHL